MAFFSLSEIEFRLRRLCATSVHTARPRVGVLPILELLRLLHSDPVGFLQPSIPSSEHAPRCSLLRWTHRLPLLRQDVFGGLFLYDLASSGCVWRILSAELAFSGRFDLSAYS